MVRRIVTVGDDFTLPATAKVADANLPERLSDGELSATYARPDRNSVVILGDSITQQNGIQGDYSGAGLGIMTGYSAAGYWTVAAALLGHRMKFLANLGVGGDTAQQIAERVPTAISHNPGWVVVEAGRNSVSAVQSAATIIACLRDDIYKPLLAAGIRVVATTITPRDGDTAPLRQVVNDVNAWIKEYARQTPGVVLADFYTAVTDGLTAAWIAGYVSDGLHPLVRGAAPMGKVLAAALSPVVPYVDTLVSNNTDTGNLLTNGLMTGTGGGNAVGAALTGTIAANWTVQGGFTGTVVGSKVARTDGKPGEWQQFNFTAGGTNRIQMRPTANITSLVAGDKVYCETEFETDAGFIPSTGYFNLVLYCYNGTTGSVSVTDNYNGALNPSGAETRLANGTLRTPVMTVPAGTTYVQMYIQLAGAGGAVRVSRCAIRKEIVL